jgi:hypothetical protein
MSFYLMWYDDDRRKPVLHKIKEAMAAYEQRFRQQPNIVLINEREHVEASLNVQLRPLPFIQPSHFYVGYEDAA